jgi:hypothetical protein
MKRLHRGCAVSMTMLMLWLVSSPALAGAGSNPVQDALDRVDREFEQMLEIAHSSRVPPARMAQIQALRERLDRCRTDVAAGRYYRAFVELKSIRAEAEDLSDWARVHHAGDPGLPEALGALVGALIIFWIVMQLFVGFVGLCNEAFGDEVPVDREEAKEVLDTLPGYWDALCTLKRAEEGAD